MKPAPSGTSPTFHQYVIEGQHDNPTVRRTIDGTLTAILGREAGHRGVRLTMAELLRETSVSADLSGLENSECMARIHHFADRS